MGDKLDAIYAKLPSVVCKGLCHDSCGLIPLAKAERDAIAEHTGRRVKTIPNVLVDLHSSHLLMRPADESMQCRYLKKGRCSIYKVRPMICRLYGVAEGMPCPHGCSPLRLVTRQEAHDLIKETAELK